MPRIRLLSTDFDGTLIGHPSDGRCVPALAEVLQEHCRAGGTWLVNTGRTLAHLEEGLEKFAAPVLPQFAIVEEREIYRRTTEGWQELEEWNRLCRELHAELWEQAGTFFKQVRAFCSNHQDVNFIEEHGRPSGLITSSDRVMEEILHDVDIWRQELPDLDYQRNTIYLRFCHRAYNKGSALQALAEHIEVDADGILVAGDQYNDLSMFADGIAGMRVCPANAISPVKDLTLKLGGWLSAFNDGEGVADGYRWYQSKA